MANNPYDNIENFLHDIFTLYCEYIDTACKRSPPINNPEYVIKPLKDYHKATEASLIKYFSRMAELRNASGSNPGGVTAAINIFQGTKKGPKISLIGTNAAKYHDIKKVMPSGWLGIKNDAELEELLYNQTDFDKVAEAAKKLIMAAPGGVIVKSSGFTLSADTAQVMANINKNLEEKAKKNVVKAKNKVSLYNAPGSLLKQNKVFQFNQLIRDEEEAEGEEDEWDPEWDEEEITSQQQPNPQNIPLPPPINPQNIPLPPPINPQNVPLPPPINPQNVPLPPPINPQNVPLPQPIPQHPPINLKPPPLPRDPVLLHPPVPQYPQPQPIPQQVQQQYQLPQIQKPQSSMRRVGFVPTQAQQTQQTQLNKTGPSQYKGKGEVYFGGVVKGPESCKTFEEIVNDLSEWCSDRSLEELDICGKNNGPGNTISASQFNDLFLYGTPFNLLMIMVSMFKSGENKALFCKPGPPTEKTISEFYKQLVKKKIDYAIDALGKSGRKLYNLYVGITKRINMRKECATMVYNPSTIDKNPLMRVIFPKVNILPDKPSNMSDEVYAKVLLRIDDLVKRTQKAQICINEIIQIKSLIENPNQVFKKNNLSIWNIIQYNYNAGFNNLRVIEMIYTELETHIGKIEFDPVTGNYDKSTMAIIAAIMVIMIFAIICLICITRVSYYLNKQYTLAKYPTFMLWMAWIT